jgi:hypothetical protein
MPKPGPLEFVEQPLEELDSEPKARHELRSEYQLADGAIEPEPFRVRTDSSSVGVSPHVGGSNHCSIFCVWNSHIQPGVIKQGPPVHILQGVETR